MEKPANAIENYIILNNILATKAPELMFDLPLQLQVWQRIVVARSW